jgi:hypothetical protein
MNPVEERRWPERLYARRDEDQISSPFLGFTSGPAANEPDREEETYVRIADHQATVQKLTEERDIQEMVAGEGGEVVADLRERTEKAEAERDTWKDAAEQRDEAIQHAEEEVARVRHHEVETAQAATQRIEKLEAKLTAARGFHGAEYRDRLADEG